jgi:hypothetical protein
MVLAVTILGSIKGNNMALSKHASMASVTCLAILVFAHAAFADHGKEGLWSVTVTIGGDAPGMPDMSKLPPEAVARMRAMGMSMNGNSITTEHCMTAQEVATDTPHMDDSAARSCKMSNPTHGGHSMSADMICSGTFKGTGHMQFTYDSDTHYSGELVMTGIANGQQLNRTQKFEGRWISANCGSVNH